jgi:hypothetical protein
MIATTLPITDCLLIEIDNQEKLMVSIFLSQHLKREKRERNLSVGVKSWNMSFVKQINVIIAQIRQIAGPARKTIAGIGLWLSMADLRRGYNCPCTP